MSEEEKRAVEFLKGVCTDDCVNKAFVVTPILNLIENQQKELNNLKEIEKSHKVDNGLLRQELDMQIEHNKELEATLKQTQDSWFEDTQKLEQEKEKNSITLSDLLEYKEELTIEKEKNKELDYQNKILQEKNQDYKCNYDIMAEQKEKALEKVKQLEEHQKQYLDGELITAKQGKFFEKMIKEKYISKDKIKAIQGQLCMQLGSYVQNEATPEQERIAGGINIINKILEEK